MSPLAPVAPGGPSGTAGPGVPPPDSIREMVISTVRAIVRRVSLSNMFGRGMTRPRRYTARAQGYQRADNEYSGSYSNYYTVFRRPMTYSENALVQLPP